MAKVSKHDGVNAFLKLHSNTSTQECCQLGKTPVLKIEIGVVAYLTFIIFFPVSKKNVYLYVMQLFSADPTIVLKYF